MTSARDTSTAAMKTDREEHIPLGANFEDFVETLQQFDADGKGMVQAAELRHLLTALGEPLTEDEVDQVFAGQVNDEGQIKIVDFVRHVLET